MKILYGIQGTGNGHITRARVLAPELRKAGFDVDFLLSGRDADKYFDMEPFPDYQTRKGLTFVVKQGKMRYLDTALHNNAPSFLYDLYKLDVKKYDLVITDFEPITAWAAKLKGVPSLGISHQYSFKYSNVPQVKANIANAMVMKWFAPAAMEVGVHWHHFNHPVFPPLIEKPVFQANQDGDFVLVYLPFEEVQEVVNWLRGFSNQKFRFYCAVSKQEQRGNVLMHPFDRAAFQQDLATCQGVVANAGFGLASESIQLGKKLLVKPVKGQGEQLSNALAIEQLGLGNAFYELDGSVAEWLQQQNRKAKDYPNLAESLTSWIASGFNCSLEELSARLWKSYA